MCSAARAGILISRSAQGLEFTDAASLLLNGKDRMLSLGGQPKATGALNKLPQVRSAAPLLKDHDSGVLAQYTSGKPEFVVPQSLPKGSPEDPAEVWKAARISYKQSSSDKAGTEVPVASFVAFLPGGIEELTRLCTDPRGLEILGGRDKTFPTQVELMAAVARKYASDPGIAPLEKYVEDALRTRYQGFESAAGGLELLDQGLKFAELSEAVYPASPEQEKLRRQLRERKGWLDRRVAILHALAAGAQWDSYLLAGRDFERYEAAFPEMLKQHTESLQASLQAHLKAAAARKQEGDYASAWREFRMAAARKPSDSALREEVMQAWTEYSRRAAMEQQSRRTRLSAGPQSTVERNLYFAAQNRQAKKLDDALKNVRDAEAVLKSSLPAGSFSTETLKALYARAEIFGAQDRIAEALDALDAYDLRAVDDERTAADKLRNQLLFTLGESLKTIKTRMQAAWSQSGFLEAGQLAYQGLRMKGDDPELLYYAGLAYAVHRQGSDARELLARYLDASDNLDANQLDRARVIRLLPTLAASPAAPPAGVPNWLSGWKVPSGAFYCPISLAFQPAIDRIDAGKLHETFEWNGERLNSVTPAIEGNAATGEKKIVFAYDDRVPQVVWASDDESARPPAPATGDATWQRSSAVLLNNPSIDPIAAQRLGGRNVALGIAFNRYFNPFVWEKIYYFRLTYDSEGRVARAQELTGGPQGNPGDQSLEFEWNGAQLTAIRGYQGKTRTYERTMQYQGGRLVSEEIQGQGKGSRIRYTYSGNRLLSAEASNDATLDNRNRKVAFRATSPSTLVK